METQLKETNKQSVVLSSLHCLTCSIAWASNLLFFKNTHLRSRHSHFLYKNPSQIQMFNSVKWKTKGNGSLPKRDCFSLASCFSQKFGPTTSNKHTKQYDIKTEKNEVAYDEMSTSYSKASSMWNLQCNRFCKWNGVKLSMCCLIDVTTIFI